MSEQLRCKTCGHTKADHFNNFVAGNACKLKGCTCQRFTKSMVLFKSWNEVNVPLERPVDPEGDVAYWRARAEKAEAALKELVLATANDMRHSEDENQDKAWSALEDLKNALVTADTILSGTWKEDE